MATGSSDGLVVFSRMSDDLLVNIFSRMEDDPRHLALVSCVCRRFCAVIRNFSWKNHCMRALPTIVPELLQNKCHEQQQLGEPPSGWASLHRLLVCCPGLRNAGVLLESWDFGLEREVGSSDDYVVPTGSSVQDSLVPAEEAEVARNGLNSNPRDSVACSEGAEADAAGGSKQVEIDLGHSSKRKLDDGNGAASSKVMKRDSSTSASGCKNPPTGDAGKRLQSLNHSRAPEGPHLASGAWTFSREQGNKLLASRFRTDSLYICDWPGCVHSEEKRQYKIFRGIFRNFKASQICRNLRDLKAKRTAIRCAFCSSESMWDMVTSFCLRRSLEYHDDGEPVVRAYVCENGHVSGAWTEQPMYIF